MSILAWIVLGLIAGFIGSKLVNKTGEGVILDIVLGIVGAIVGGYLFSIFGAHGVTGVNLYSLFVAVIGAVIVLVVFHAVRGGGRACERHLPASDRQGSNNPLPPHKSPTRQNSRPRTGEIFVRHSP